MSEPILTLTGIRKSFGSNEILKGIDLTVSKGQVVGILGSSGSGKTTLLRCINSLETPDSGVVRINGTQVDYSERYSQNDILQLRRKTAMVFQNYNLFKNKTAIDNITAGLIHVQRKSKAEAQQIARHALVQVGLADLADRYPIQLSGGQQQRVSIARALALNPEVILFDEPTSALDPELVGDVNRTITQVAETGVTMVIVTHEIRFAHHVADRIVFVDQGRILEQGTPEQVIDHPTAPRIKEFLSRLEEK